MKRCMMLFLIIVLVMFLTVTGCSKKEKTFLSIATGSTGGAYYPIGGALAQILNQYVPGTSVAA